MNIFKTIILASATGGIFKCKRGLATVMGSYYKVPYWFNYCFLSVGRRKGLELLD